MRDRRIRLVLASVVVAMAGVGVAMAATRSTSAKNGTVKTAKVGKFGTVLVASNGMTLYRYTPDKKNVSVCNGACASYWPPLLVKGTAKPTVGSGASASLLGTTMRTGGAEQVTYAGFPLYYYAGDKKPGQANGAGLPEDVVRRQRDRRARQARRAGVRLRRDDDEEVRQRLGLSKAAVRGGGRRARPSPRLRTRKSPQKCLVPVNPRAHRDLARENLPHPPARVKRLRVRDTEGGSRRCQRISHPSQKARRPARRASSAGCSGAASRSSASSAVCSSG